MNKSRRRLIQIFLTALVIVIPLNFFFSPVNAWEIDRTGTVYYIYDGDTLNATSVGIIRLADINTPESNESGYTAATNYLRTIKLYDVMEQLRKDKIRLQELKNHSLILNSKSFDTKRNCYLSFWKFFL